MDSIAKTSLLTAAMRAVESKRPDRLFADPYADILAGEIGHELRNRAIAESGDQPAIAIRTKFVDEKINQAIHCGIHQFVFLAAGMDTRAYRMDFPYDSKVFEIDRHEVFEYKATKMKNAQPRCERRQVVADLRTDWPDALLNAGFKRGVKTFWLIEGLVMYLEENEVKELFKNLSALASLKDILVMDLLSQTLLEFPQMQKQLQFLASIGTPWKFGHNDPIGFLKTWGWQAELSQAGEVAPERWPFPTAPLTVANIPRGFYVAAEKINTNEVLK